MNQAEKEVLMVGLCSALWLLAGLSKNNQVRSNYIITVIFVMLECASLAELSQSSARAAQQELLDNYGRWTQRWSGLLR